MTVLCSISEGNGTVAALAGSPPRSVPNRVTIPPGATAGAKAAASTRPPVGSAGVPNMIQYGIRRDVVPVWLATLTNPSKTPVTTAVVVTFNCRTTVWPGPGATEFAFAVTCRLGSETSGWTETL